MANAAHNATYANGQVKAFHIRTNNVMIGNQVNRASELYEEIQDQQREDHEYEDVPSLRGIKAASSKIRSSGHRKRRQRNTNFAVITVAILAVIASLCACAVMYWKMDQCEARLHGELKQVHVPSARSGTTPVTPVFPQLKDDEDFVDDTQGWGSGEDAVSGTTPSDVDDSGTTQSELDYIAI